MSRGYEQSCPLHFCFVSICGYNALAEKGTRRRSFCRKNILNKSKTDDQWSPVRDFSEDGVSPSSLLYVFVLFCFAFFWFFSFS